MRGDPSNRFDGGMGLALAAQGRTDEATRSFREALSREPRYANARYRLAVLLKRRGQLEESRYHYQEAMRINPAYAGGRTMNR